MIGFIHIMLLLIFYSISVIIHELGHVIAGKIVNVNPDLVIFGNGKNETFKIKLFGVLFILTNSINRGITYSCNTPQNHLKLRLIIFIAGGFTFQIIIISLLYFFFGLKFLDEFTKQKFYILDTFVYNDPQNWDNLEANIKV